MWPALVREIPPTLQWCQPLWSQTNSPDLGVGCLPYWVGGSCRQLRLSPSLGKRLPKFTIVHLEMVNMLLALRLFAPRWTQRKVRVRCDNQAVVDVLRSGKTKYPFLGACARNIWFWSARFDVDMRYDHITIYWKHSSGSAVQVDWLISWQHHFAFLHTRPSVVASKWKHACIWPWKSHISVQALCFIYSLLK